jgi:hypothetical protein
MSNKKPSFKLVLNEEFSQTFRKNRATAFNFDAKSSTKPCHALTHGFRKYANPNPIFTFLRARQFLEVFFYISPLQCVALRHRAEEPRTEQLPPPPVRRQFSSLVLWIDR